MKGQTTKEINQINYTYPVIWNAGRFIIISLIIKSNGKIGFTQLQKELQTTAGNLASHMRALRQAKFIKEKRIFIGRRPHTTYSLSKNGKKEWDKFKFLISLHLQNIQHNWSNVGNKT